METIATGLIIIGALVSLAGGIWFLIVAFQESVLWGLGCMFIPFVSLIFLILNFADAWRPFVVSLVGTGICVGGALLAGPTP